MRKRFWIYLYGIEFMIFLKVRRVSHVFGYNKFRKKFYHMKLPA